MKKGGSREAVSTSTGLGYRSPIREMSSSGLLQEVAPVISKRC